MGIYRRFRDARLATPSVALLSAGTVAVVTLYAATGLFPEPPTRDGGTLPWLGGTALVVLVAVAPPAALLGIAQAGALHAAERERNDWASAAGWIVGIGTVVAAVAATLTGLLLVPICGPRWSLVALAVPMVGVATRHRRAPRAAAGLALVAVAAAPLGPRYFLGPAFDHAPVLYAEHGVQDTTAVVTIDRPTEPRIRRLVANGVSYSGDSLLAQRYMRLLGHLPALAARENRDAAVVCVGTGTTLAALATHDFSSIDAIDISPSVRETLNYFSHVNGSVHQRADIHLRISDGDRFLRTTNKRYDVITLEPPPPRAPWASILYSREFYDAANDRLREGGIFAQWLPLHGITAWEADLLSRTFLDVFPIASLHLVERNEAILLGVKGRTFRSTPPMPPADAIADLASVGAGPGVVRETRVAEGEILKRLVGSGRLLHYAFPGTEYAPLSIPELAKPLDSWAHRLSQVSDLDQSTFAGRILPVVAPFIRVRAGRGSPSDRTAVADTLLQLVASNPGNEYYKSMVGYGELLKQRLEQPNIAPKQRRQAIRQIDGQREWAKSQLKKLSAESREADAK